MDTLSHKEVRPSADGSRVAVGSSSNEVRVVQTSDGLHIDIPDAAYDFGGRRLALDPSSDVLFSGAYRSGGVGAYVIRTGEQRWHRRDLKRLQKIAFDPCSQLVYCAFASRPTMILNASSGREKKRAPEVTDFYFASGSPLAVLDAQDVIIQQRETGVRHLLEREAPEILDVAFTRKAIVVAWVSGPVTAYDSVTGSMLWRYAPPLNHAYSLAPAAQGDDVWIVEQPFAEPPWHRICLLSARGEVLREIRCGLGHSFSLIPHRDLVMGADMVPVAIESLDSSSLARKG